MIRVPEPPVGDPEVGGAIARRAVAQHQMERQQCLALINELYFLHTRLAILLARVMGRETNEDLRQVLVAQYTGDQLIAHRLRTVALAHGMVPCPSMNSIAAGLLEDVRYANHHKDALNGRPVALQNALQTVRLHGIHTWGRLMDAVDTSGPAGLKPEALALQTLEADLYKALASLSPARSVH